MDINSCYENLANRIIIQAADDYRSALRKLSRNPYSENAKVRKKEIELFFRSDEFRMLTRVDCEMLIRRLKSEVR